MSHDPRHQELRVLLGAYVLGGLDSADRARLQSHLAACPECEAELARLAPVPGLLSRLHEPLDPAAREDLRADLLPRIVEGALRERRRLQGRALMAGLAVAAAVLTVVALSVRVLTVPDAPTPTTVALQASGSHDAAGSASLVAKPWGTEMVLELEGMPRSGPFRLEVTDAEGSRQVAATWGTTPTGEAVVAGAAALPPDAVRLVRVLGPDGTVLEGAVRQVRSGGL